MSKMYLVSYLLHLEYCHLSKKEKMLLELMLFDFSYKELYEIFKDLYKDYRKSIPFHHQESNMLDINFIQEMIKDILSTEEYTLSGIAIYTSIPEDVLFDVAAGLNVHPTFEIFRRIFELHMTVKRELYEKIVDKLLFVYMAKKSASDKKEDPP